jgi:hypothetical protein
LKISAIIILLTHFVLINAYSENLEVIPLKINYHGAFKSGPNIIVYGDFGTISISTNKGKSWTQKSITTNGDICQVISYNDTLWALTSNCSILQSFDNGQNWSSKKLQLGSDDRFYNFCLNDNNIYIRTKNKVLCYDRKFNLKSEYSDAILELEDNDWPYIISSYNSYKFITLSDNKIVLSVYSDNIGKLLILSENLIKIGIIELSKFIQHPAWHYECRNKFNYKNKDVWQIGTKLYYADENFTKWTYIFPDTAIGNYVSDRTLNPFTYNIIDDEIYITFRVPSTKVSRMKTNTIQNYDIGIKRYKDSNNSFEVVGNLFRNDYFTIYPVTDLQDGISGVTMNNCLFVFEDSVFILAGANKTLLESTNNGTNWNLVSYLSGAPRLIQNDSIIYFLNDGYETNDISISYGNGESFLPIIAGYIYGTGYLQTFSNILCLQLDSHGDGFLIGSNHNNTKKNILKTDDGLATFDSVQGNILYIYPDNMTNSNVSKVYDKYIIAFNYFYQDYEKYYNYIYQIDTSYQDIKLINVDSNSTIKYILSDSPDKFRLLISTKLNTFDERKFEIWETTDSGKTFISILSMKQDFEIHNIYEFNPDSVFISTLNDNKIFLYDKKRNAFDLLYSNPNNSISNIQLAFFNNKFYILGDPLFLENIDRNDLTKWSPSKWDFGTPSFYSAIFKGNTIIVDMSDSLRERNYYRLKFPMSTGVYEPLTNKFNCTVIPNPAYDFITIHFENELNNIEIISSMGVKILELPFSKQVDISNLCSGVYFVKVGNQISKFIKI